MRVGGHPSYKILRKLAAGDLDEFFYMCHAFLQNGGCEVDRCIRWSRAGVKFKTGKRFSRVCEECWQAAQLRAETKGSDR